MNTLLVILASCLTSIFPTTQAAPTEKWVAEKAAYSFDTFIRVKVPVAQVVEAEDAQIVGEQASYIQSLFYTAQKSADFQGVYASETEWKALILKQLCGAEHEMDLTPVRYDGSKGERVFRSKIKPFSVSISGKILKDAAPAKAFSTYVICPKVPRP
jgi:hypothetical protein